jgi:hypothetical protein
MTKEDALDLEKNNF